MIHCYRLLRIGPNLNLAWNERVKDYVKHYRLISNLSTWISIKKSSEHIGAYVLMKEPLLIINFMSWKLREIEIQRKIKQPLLSFTKRKKIFTHIIFTDNIFIFKKVMMALITLTDWLTFIEHKPVPSSTRCFTWIISFNSWHSIINKFYKYPILQMNKLMLRC